MPRSASRVLSRALLAVPLLFGLSGCPGGSTADIPAGPVVAIGAVQGDGDRSPLAGERLTIEGVVVADLDGGAGGDGDLGGWFVQDGGDGDAATSDALFVRGDGADAGLDRGDLVRIHGRVMELDQGGGSRMTAIAAEAIAELSAGELPDATVLETAPADWERLEGMRVRIEVPLSLIGTRALADEGRVDVAFGGRLWQPTEKAAPGSEEARAIAAGNARRRLSLGDAHSGVATHSPLPRNTGRARLGSTFTHIEAVVDQRDGGPVLQVLAMPTLETAARPSAPEMNGDVRIASLNLENLFNGDGRGEGFPTERGARSKEQFTRQLRRHIATLRGLDADVVALMELENDGHGRDSTLASLVAALRDDDAGPWRYVDAGEHTGDDAIRVGLLYRLDRVRPVGRTATLEDGPFSSRSRVPLAQAFVPVADGRVEGPPFLVVANHFKSKGCGSAEGANADHDDGAGCWNAVRTESARRLDAWLKTDPTGTGTALVAILGDLNSYAGEDPIRLLREAGWRDAFAVAGVDPAYSYVYDGLLGRLDHALLSPALAQRLRGAAAWHANADTPRSLGYRDNREPGPWRSSDHDPLLLGFDLRRAP